MGQGASKPSSQSESKPSSPEEIVPQEIGVPSGLCSGAPVRRQAPAGADGTCVLYEGSGPWFKCKPDALVPPRFAEAGFASSEKCPATTLPELLKEAATWKGDKEYLKVERPLPPLDKDGKAPPALHRDEWQTWTYKQAYDEVRTAAMGFIKLGFKQFDSVNVWGFNCPEWNMSAFAANFAGGKVAGIYPTDTMDMAAYKVVHSGGSIVVLEDKAKLETLCKGLSSRGDAKRLKAIVAYGFEPGKNETVIIDGTGHVPVYSWKALLELGKDLESGDQLVDDAMANTKPGHCSSLVYTSGTTGNPKAVMISHDCLIFESSCVCQLLATYHKLYAEAEEERIISYLPLSHIAGMMVDLVCPIVSAARTRSWTTVFFARPYDFKVGSFKHRLVVARPTIFLGVPLVWEKLADAIRSIGAVTTGAKKKIADWAKGVSLEYARNLQLGGSGSAPSGHTVAKAVLGKVKAALGLDALKYAITGAAPMRVATLEYFGSLGIFINELYGMSECTGACTCSVDAAHAWGSCGWEIPGVEVKAFIVDPDDLNKKKECPRAPDLESAEESFQGELCFRGRNIMMGYMAQPELGQAHIDEIEQKTGETIDSEGWLHSGDKGMVTEQGMVKITGRYKELIIGEGGENIAPVPIEDNVKKLCDGINEIMMIGDKRKYNVALITLKAKGANGEVPGTDELDAAAARLNPDVQTITAALDDKAWIDTVTAAIKDTNNNGKVCPNAPFKIQKFMILPSNFSEQAGELTPTKKLKRKVVETKYAAMIDKMYQTDGTYIRYSEQ